MKRHEALIHAAACLDLRGIVLREEAELRRRMLCDSIHLAFWDRHELGREIRAVAPRGLSVGRGLTAEGQGGTFLGQRKRSLS